MKKQILVIASMVALSSSVYASKARMEALHQDAEFGSFYIKDTRSIFKNPSSLNTVTNHVMTEWGASNNDGSATTPRAEGGFFKDLGYLSIGVYLGHERNAQNARRNNEDGVGGNNGNPIIQAAENNRGGYTINAATFNTGHQNFQDYDDAMDFFVAGDMANMKWGARLHFAGNTDEAVDHPTDGTKTIERKHSALGIGLGAEVGFLGVFANLGLKDKSEGAANGGDKWEADKGINFGVTADLMGWILWAQYDKSGYEYTAKKDDVATNDDNTAYSNKAILIGAGKVHEVTTGARVFTEIYYKSEKEAWELKATTLAPTRNLKHEKTTVTLPVVIGFEADATSWLTLRGSANYEVKSYQKLKIDPGAGIAADPKSDKNFARMQTTTVAAGATLNFGKLKIDGTISTTRDRSGSANPETRDVLRLDGLMTQVAATYWF